MAGASELMQRIQPDVSKLVGAGCQLVFGAFFTLIASTVFLVTWSTDAHWFFLLFVGAFVVTGLWLVVHGLWVLLVKRLLTGTAFGPASASLSSDRVRLGDVLTVRYEQVALRALQVRGVQIQLVLREHAIERRGRNTYNHYFTRVVDQYEESGRSLARGETLAASCTLRVPKDSMHSFDAPRNKVTWMVRIAIDVPGRPDVAEEISVQVVPEMAQEGT